MNGKPVPETIVELEQQIVQLHKNHLSTLYETRGEIVRLREEIAVLKPQAIMYDAIMQILGRAKPERPGGEMTKDVVWEINSVINNIEAKIREIA